MALTSSGSQPMVEGLFVIHNGYGKSFSEAERMACNDVHAAGDLAEELGLSAIMIEEVQNRRQLSTYGGKVTTPGVMAVFYIGERAENADIVHGVLFIDDEHQARLSQPVRAALGARAIATSAHGESATPALPDRAEHLLATYGYHAGDDELASVVPLYAEIDQSVESTAIAN